MEAAPLTKAHDYAKAASAATQTADTTVAITQHTLAAGEFSNAARSTNSVEALRTLRLLEDHHKKLSELLKLPLEQTSQPSNPDGEISEEADEKQQHPEAGDDGKAGGKQSKAGGGAASPASAGALSTAKPLPTLSQQQRRYPGRDLSSSIASNLASARGIRSSRYRGQPLTPSVSNDQAPGSLEVHSRRDGSSSATPSRPADQKRKPSWVPPGQQPAATKNETRTSDAQKTEGESPASPTDEGFSRFYSTFGSLINRLSAPLAFAGLPLITEESATEPTPPAPIAEPTPPPPKRTRHKPSITVSASTHAEPDLTKIYSRATLRALAKDGHGPADSFYVVPTAGGTVSYANILTFDQKERRRLAASTHGGDDAEPLDGPDDDDDFVDARESAVAGVAGSPTLRKHLGKGGGGGRGSDRDRQNFVEELYLENKSLKEMLDKLSTRLHLFELNSQNSHLALAQSIRLQAPGSPMSSSGGVSAGGKLEPGAGGDEGLKRRNQELEDQLASSRGQLENMEKEYRKLEMTVDKYRDRWEKLKAGAKARREAQGSAENNAESAASPQQQSLR